MDFSKSIDKALGAFHVISIVEKFIINFLPVLRRRALYWAVAFEHEWRKNSSCYGKTAKCTHNITFCRCIDMIAIRWKFYLKEA